jgi:hypothetical protein
MNPEEQLRRRLNLQKAAWLGNTHKHKVTLSFRADQSLYAVQTTVWSVTDTHVGLKGGVGAAHRQHRTGGPVLTV